MYLAPGDQWPRHSRPQARAALEEARAAGWWFRPSAGHTFGRLRCTPPDQDPGNDACKVPVYSTSGPEDGSETSRAIRDALRKCPHHRGGQVPEALTPDSAARLAAGALTLTARLIEAAQALLRKNQALTEADGVVEAALGRLDDKAAIDQAEVAVSELERLARVEDARGLAAAAGADAGDPWPPVDGAQELFTLATERLKAAGSLVMAAQGAEEEGKLAAERGRLASLLQALSTQLGGDR